MMESVTIRPPIPDQHTFGAVGQFSRDRLKSMSRRPNFVTVFWKRPEWTCRVIRLCEWQ